MKCFKAQLVAVLMSIALLPFAGTAAAGTLIGGGPLGAGTYTATSDISLVDFVDDPWTFSLAQASNVTVSLASVDQTISFPPLVTLVFGLDTVTGELAGSAGQFFTVFSLTAGTTYDLLVNGVIGADLDGGSYTVSLNVASVPLPAAAWLFGSAILGLTVVARRRNSQRSGITA